VAGVAAVAWRGEARQHRAVGAGHGGCVIYTARTLIYDEAGNALSESVAELDTALVEGVHGTSQHMHVEPDGTVVMLAYKTTMERVIMKEPDGPNPR
jgi:hypothetical protein